jgi:hypothetical protein
MEAILAELALALSQAQADAAKPQAARTMTATFNGFDWPTLAGASEKPPLSTKKPQN